MLEKALDFGRWSGAVLKAHVFSVPGSEDIDLGSQKAGHLILPALPYRSRNLGGALSRKTIDAHMQVHKKYVDKTRELVTGTDFADMPLVEVIRKLAKDEENRELYLNASQAWNHAAYWLSISPPGQDTSPSGELLKAVKAEFGDVESCRDKMMKEAAKIFGSGWLWLIRENDKPKIIISKDAISPVAYKDMKPLFCIDFWEHAYYLDYKSDRRAYVNMAVQGLLNWGFADRNWEQK